MSSSALKFEVALTAPAERVFAALTEARHLQRWFCDTCESEPRVNGRLHLRWTKPGSSREPFEARWVEFVPCERAAFQGGHVGYPDGNAGTVWFTLTTGPDGTRLHARHELPARPGYDALLDSWRAAWPRAFERLQRYLTPLTDPRD